MREHFGAGIGQRGQRLRASWLKRIEAYPDAHPDLADQLVRMQKRELPERWDLDMPSFSADPKGVASRDASARTLNAIASRCPWLLGGAADLAPSTKTQLTFEAAGDFGGRNLHFCVREHAMGAILNGLALSNLRAYGSSFLIFSDYMRPAIRLSALMALPVVYIFTHDSIGLGHDGPTHQPVEQLLALRAVPGLVTLRPADANEVVEAWRVIIGLKHQPACLALSRQALPTFDRSRYTPAAGVALGAYVLADARRGKSGKKISPEVILIGTGSEVSLCIAAFEQLEREGIAAWVVSMPPWELFEQQEQAYRDGVLPPEFTARVSIEAGTTIGWDRYVGAAGEKIGMRGFRSRQTHTFGEKMPSAMRFGFGGHIEGAEPIDPAPAPKDAAAPRPGARRGPNVVA